MDKAIYPLTFAPVFRNYIWGGRNLETKLGRSIPPGIVAESWDISGYHSSPTVVDNGSMAGKPLPELVTILGVNLVGSRSHDMLNRGKFPLLIKLLDVNKPLSVQVHPGDDYARVYENDELGKTEMWHILHAEPDAGLIYGLKSGTTPALFRQALEEGHIKSCLHHLPVKAGDTIFIPAGSLHAIMSGVVLAEVQQNSDATYRIYDWNRLGNDGKPRPLHIDKALDVIDFNLVEPAPFPAQLLAESDDFRHELITTCPYFNVEKVTFKRDSFFNGKCDGHTFEIWGAISGQAQVVWSGRAVKLPSVRFTLLPATLGDFKIEGTAFTTLLRVYVPE